MLASYASPRCWTQTVLVLHVSKIYIREPSHNKKILITFNLYAILYSYYTTK